MADGQRLAWLHAHVEIPSEIQTEDNLGAPAQRLKVRLSQRELGRFALM
jgi:GTPase